MLIDIFISFSGNIARGKSGAFDIGLGLIGLLVCFCCVILNSPKLTLEGLFLPIARDSKPLFLGTWAWIQVLYLTKKKGTGNFRVLHKNNTFIQVFSSTSTYGAFIFSLDTKHKYGGRRGEGGEERASQGWGSKWRMTATFAVRTGLEEKAYRP